MKQLSISSAYQFQSRQIVCLDHETTSLYAEVIDVIPARLICWVRPLLLAVRVTEDEPLPVEPPKQLIVYDLRQGSDLIWPTILFRPALDTEVIPFLVQLEDSDALIPDRSEAHKQLSWFVRNVWQAYKSAFYNS